MYKVRGLNLRWFKASEFGASLPFMSTNWLLKLDAFRGRLGLPVIISPAIGSLYRPSGGSESQHFYGRAGDVMLPMGPDLLTAYKAAQEVGFTGIGVYPYWTPYKGLHLDVRPDRKPGNPAVWSGLKDESGRQYYAALESGFIA